MAIILKKVLQFLFRGVTFAAPFLTGIVPIIVGGGASLYGLWALLYSFVSSRQVQIVQFFDYSESAVNALRNYFSSGTISNAICYSCAIDTLLSVIGYFSVFAFSVITFLLSTVIAAVVGFAFKLIVAQIVKSAVKSLSVGAISEL